MMQVTVRSSSYKNIYLELPVDYKEHVEEHFMCILAQCEPRTRVNSVLHNINRRCKWNTLGRFLEKKRPLNERSNIAYHCVTNHRLHKLNVTSTFLRILSMTYKKWEDQLSVKIDDTEHW